MIVGAGGNGSWLLRHLHRLVQKGQIPDAVTFTVFDGDDVEKKNTLYQDYDLKDVLENKAKVMGSRYDVQFKPRYVKDPKDFVGFNVVVCCVDNKDFREILYDYAASQPDLYWIDVRAEGTNVVIYSKSKKNTLDVMRATLPKDGKSTSCQREFELSSGIIQLGNQIAAAITAQYLLNYIREEENPPVFNHMF